MGDKIDFSFDDKICGYLISMPDFVKLSDIESWIINFDLELKTFQSLKPISILLDSNKHKFESIQCLKALRDYLTHIQEHIAKAAFVAPTSFREPEIVSGREAYFDKFEDAYLWLENK